MAVGRGCRWPLDFTKKKKISHPKNCDARENTPLTNDWDRINWTWQQQQMWRRRLLGHHHQVSRRNPRHRSTTRLFQIISNCPPCCYYTAAAPATTTTTRVKEAIWYSRCATPPRNSRRRKSVSRVYEFIKKVSAAGRIRALPDAIITL